MARTSAVFGGEHSAHYYFREFWGADNGMLAALNVLAELGANTEPMSALRARFTPYAMSGEINSTVADVSLATDDVRRAFASRASEDTLDGLTMLGTVAEDEPFWWFSVRPSNTEPLLRLNVEAADHDTMTRIRDEVLALIRKDAP
jgi:phosphomannomutase